jgi:EpsD family peptidyl-prolyl cis-trans isomerase
LKSQTLLIALAAGACLTTTGCDKVKSLLGGGKPTGQVVATVDGKEITALELKAELGGFNAPDPKIMKAAEQQALQTIVLRRVVADEARKEKLDKSSDYTIQVERGEDTLLAQMLERKITQGLTPPTSREAQAYVDSHPDQFANRRILNLDQLIAPVGKVDPSKITALKTLEEVKRQFAAENTPFQESSGELDTLTAPPGLIAQIGKLQPGEPFVVPQRGVWVFSRVSGQKSAPLTGDLANNYALRFLTQQQAQTAIRTRLTALRKASDSKIVYAANYKPPAASPAAQAASAAAAKPAAK